MPRKTHTCPPLPCYVVRMLRNEPDEDRHRGPVKGSTRRGFGRLRRERSGRWSTAYVGPDTVLYKHPGTFGNEDDARAWLSTERKLIDLDAWTPPSERSKTKRQRGETFRDYSTKWLAGRKTSRGEPLKPRTVSEYQRYLDRHLLPAFGDLPVKSLRAATVEDWYDAMGSATPTERAHCYQLLRAICTTAVEGRLLAANPCAIKGAGLVRTAKRMEPATLAELETITAAMPERLQLAVLLGSWCALRYGEVAELRRGDIDLMNAVVNVSRGVTWPNGKATVGTPKSRAGHRPVDIPPHLLPAVRDHLEKHVGKVKTALLFPAANGGHLHPRTFGKRIDNARDAAGRPDLTFHMLRHTGAVLAAQTGATLAELMERLGHSTPGAALRYQHAAKGRGKAIAASMSKMVKGVEES